MNSRLIRLKRPILMSAMFLATAGALAAQDAQSSPSPYQGVSNPPADDQIITTTIPAAKPPAGQPAAQPTPPAPSSSVQTNAQGQALMPSAVQGAPQPSSVGPSVNFPAPQGVDGTDDGIVRVAPTNPQAGPVLNQRAETFDPDGDIVHPQPPQPGELQAGTSIRVHLLDRLSTSETGRGEPFRSTVASDVMQGGQVLIPAGSEIDGRVVEVSSGHTGASGSMRLQPDTVILPNGARFSLHAELTSTPGSHTRVGNEGTIKPNSRVKRDGIEYGGAVGAGVVTGAFVGGPVGALTGGLIGAGVVTVHLLVSHQQATLDSGTTLIFQLTDPLFLAPEPISGN